MMIPEHHQSKELSQTGQQRRRQMLSELQGEVKTVARRRKARKVTSISAVVLALVGGVTWSGMALYNSRSSPFITFLSIQL